MTTTTKTSTKKTATKKTATKKPATKKPAKPAAKQPAAQKPAAKAKAPSKPSAKPAKPSAKPTKKPAPNAVTAATKKPAKPAPRKGKRPSGLDLAAKVLADASEPLAAKAIAERVVAAGWQTSGKTPHATLYAAMMREIQTKGKDARFVKVDRGRFKAKS